MDTDKKPKHARKHRVDFPPSLGKRMVKRSDFPTTRIDRAAAETIANVAEHIVRIIGEAATDAVNHRGAVTITANDIAAACKLRFPREFAAQAIDAGNKEITEKTKEVVDKSKDAKRRTSLAPLALARILRKTSGKRVGQSTGHFLAAVVDYVCKEFIAVSVETDKDLVKTISPRALGKAKRTDSDLGRVLKKVEFVEVARNKKKRSKKTVPPAAEE